MQDWPRNDQVLRVDWNVAHDTMVYGRLQFGYEKRSGGVSILGSTGGWPQMPTKYEIDTVGYVNTVLHTFSPTLFGEFTVGVNWSHQNTSPVDQAALTRTTARWCCPGCRSSSRRRTRSTSCRRRSSAAASRNLVSFGVEQRLPVLRVQHAVQLLEQHHEGSGRAHGQERASSSSTRRGRPSGRRASTGTYSFNTDGSNPRNTNIGFANALLGAITGTPSPTATRRRTASSSSPSGTRRTPGA